MIFYDFRCKLCNQELLFSMCSIGEHLRIKHNISTVTQYRWEHCVQQKLVQQVFFLRLIFHEKIPTKIQRYSAFREQ